MILIISTCKDPLSELEFVRPVALLLKEHTIKHHSEVGSADIANAQKIIICGTALKDFDYLNEPWAWIRTCEKPILGICSGMQVIAYAFGVELSDKKMIGPQMVEVVRENKLASGSFNAYFLHTKTGIGDFDVLATALGSACMIKHPSKEIYGCIFHPEVMNENIITNFAAE